MQIVTKNVLAILMIRGSVKNVCMPKLIKELIRDKFDTRIDFLQSEVSPIFFLRVYIPPASFLPHPIRLISRRFSENPKMRRQGGCYRYYKYSMIPSYYLNVFSRYQDISRSHIPECEPGIGG